MKTPLVIIIVLVVAILGFLTIYSQQHDMTAQTQGEGAAGGGYGSAAPAGGGYGGSSSAPAAGGYGGAPAEGHGSAPAAGGYGAAPSSGGYGK
ncbi:MAG: protein product from transcript [Nitrospirae bacterium]|nr:MAG: protein product from transcript [Nitrospirota bacterium]